ncbi:MAG: SHOCT domain-containing protein [Lactobacillales bacterium]|jgi:hypothetical protein|nr:SHOCT domain-containing protein [Lactobacillales bacterium]
MGLFSGNKQGKEFSNELDRIKRENNLTVPIGAKSIYPMFRQFVPDTEKIAMFAMFGEKQSNFLLVSNKHVYLIRRTGPLKYDQVVLNYNDIISLSTSGLVSGTLEIGTARRIYNVEKIYTLDAKHVIAEIQKYQSNTEQPVMSQATSSADELKKFYDLLQQGIITQEEFNKKKKELL